MSELSSAADLALPAHAQPFRGSPELFAAHEQLLDCYEAKDELKTADPASSHDDLHGDVLRFLERGAATGGVLEALRERSAAQTLLDYWVSVLMRKGIAATQVYLRKFSADALPSLDDDAYPYPRSAPIAEAKDLFGRDDESALLAEATRRARLVVVTGPAGSGKTSLVRAGLLPLLAASAQAPGHSGPLEPHAPEALVALNSVRAGTLLVLDPLDDLFMLLNADQRSVFGQALERFFREGQGCVIATLREQYRSALLELVPAAGAELAIWFPIQPLGLTGLREAIVEPARRANLHFHTAALDGLIAASYGRPDALALLQASLELLWPMRERNRISKEVYQRFGAPGTAFGRDAEARFEQIPPARRDEVKRILLALVRVEDGKVYRQRRFGPELLSAPTGHEVSVESKQSALTSAELLRSLEESRFVRLSRHTDRNDQVVEIHDEALLHSWPRLDGWLQSLRNEVAHLETLRSWDHAGRRTRLSLLGRDLDEIGRFYALSQDERALVARARDFLQQTSWSEHYLSGNQSYEQRLFLQLAHDVQLLQRRVKRTSRASNAKRAFNAKSILALRGTLSVLSALPPELATGFLQPGACHPITARYSSSSPRVRPDSARSGYGIGLRVHDREVHYDLLLADSPTSPYRDAAQFAAWVAAVGAPRWWMAILLARLGVREATRLMQAVLRNGAVAKTSLATRPFWSKTPYKLNELAVKYQLVPTATPGEVLRPLGHDFLRRELIARLAQGPIVYELCIQRYVDEVRTPIEDHTVLWDTGTQREIVATLKFEQGAFDRQDADFEAQVEQIAFNPWNTIDAMRPLGSLNRARKTVYMASVTERTRPTTPWVTRLAHAVDVSHRSETTLLVDKLGKLRHWSDQARPTALLTLHTLFRDMQQTCLQPDDTVSPSTSAFDLELSKPCPYRTLDGSGNDPIFPEMGSSARPIARNFPDRAISSESSPELIHPAPRVTSLALLARNRGFRPSEHLNLLGAAWAHFQADDWLAHSAERSAPLEPLADRRVAASHWWDAAQVYGADADTRRLLRGTDQRTLALTSDGLLPLRHDGLPRAASNQSWWCGLELLHTLFAREHNAICRKLTDAHPDWSPERHFEVSRLVNVALMAKIHLVEWLPSLTANSHLQAFLRDQWWGGWGVLSASVSEGLRRVGGDGAISGIPGSSRDWSNVPFALTEEFVTASRMHSLLPDVVTFPAQSRHDARNMPFPALMFGGSRAIVRERGLYGVAHALLVGRAGALSLHNYPHFLSQRETPGSALQDVGALEILRDRSRGIPRYNRFRELLGMPRIGSYVELTQDAESARELENVYGHDGIDRVDFMVGCLAEKCITGSGVSETALRILVFMTLRRLKSDRFFTDDYNEETYSREGLAWIRDNGMLSVLRRHLPELAPTLARVAHPFEPWSPDPEAPATGAMERAKALLRRLIGR